MSVSVNRTAQRYSSGGQSRPRMVLLHTTEGGGWPGYGGGSSAPHATIKPIPNKGIEVREHIAWDQFAKALQNRPGGVQTNTTGVLQFELMGTCDARSAGSMYYWPDADETVMRSLADYLRPIMARYNIPHTSNVTFKDYNRGQVPSSYGLSNGVRMSGTKWMSFRGICGHQHAPENDHGDPGDFDVKALIKYLGGSTAAASEGELSMSDVKTILNALEDQKEANFKVAVDVKKVRSQLRNTLTWGQREELTPATAKAIGWGSRKNPTMTVGGQIMTTMRLAADAASGVQHTQAELAKIADDVDALVEAEAKRAEKEAEGEE